MPKRNHEDAVALNGMTTSEPITKKAKKDKKEKIEKKRNAESEVESHDGVSAEDQKKQEKRRRKEEKRAAKAAAAASEDTPANGTADKDAAKAARKALKRAKREAEKAKEKTAERASRESTETINGHSEAPITTSHSASGYTEDPALTALPQSEIDAFIAEKMITVTDSRIGSAPIRPITSFKYLPITDEAQRAPFKNYTTPTPIQAAVWPYLLSGRDVIGVAETGSGKTMAFGVPCIRFIASLPKERNPSIKACIVSPTRELALQIHEQLEKLAAPAGLKIACVYGGVNKDQQRMTLGGVSAIVATPGRLKDFIQEGSIDLSNVRYMVLDEADRMLDKGFEEDIKTIVSTTASIGRQTLMFTATWPPSVRELAETFMQTPVRVNIGDNPTGELRANIRIEQQVEVMDGRAKEDRLLALLRKYQSGKNKEDRILVFCLYKKEATRIEKFIASRGFNVGGIHGDLSQRERTASLEAFKLGKVPCLVATDVAARGLDIPAVKVVINVTFPLTVSLPIDKYLFDSLTSHRSRTMSIVLVELVVLVRPVLLSHSLPITTKVWLVL